ncbi:MAG: hypothetical protein GX076_00160 [Clostridiales bacterium]|nr:hypothetical protein [Clostridiales bacterium]
MLPVVLGAILGVAVAWFNFRLLLRTVEGVSKTTKSTETYVLSRNLLRSTLYAVAIIASVMLEQINALATGAGIVAVAIIYFIKYTRSKSNGKKDD